MLWAAVIRYGNPQKIQEVRPVHRQYLASLRERGKLWASGPFEDDSGALIIYQAESEAEARSLLENDPFYAAGVFQEIVQLKPWRIVFTPPAS
ncbi:MAG: YciI family protein [Thermomicrobium sp.]|nr:YciI family protein [Thermomicrobium sp.]MDW8059859.1 YciI family protein [Thermomicrobium sp.]